MPVDLLLDARAVANNSSICSGVHDLAERRHVRHIGPLSSRAFCSTARIRPSSRTAPFYGMASTAPAFSHSLVCCCVISAFSPARRSRPTRPGRSASTPHGRSCRCVCNVARLFRVRRFGIVGVPSFCTCFVVVRLAHAHLVRSMSKIVSRRFIAYGM